MTEEPGWLSYFLYRAPSFIGGGAPCEMLVTIANSGLKDFAVALPKGSKLRCVFYIKLFCTSVCEICQANMQCGGPNTLRIFLYILSVSILRSFISGKASI